jgi:multicomponent Na+:H+ antiporter subunit D
MYLNLGAAVEETARHAPRIKEGKETEANEQRTPAAMWLRAVALLAVGLGIALWPGVIEGAVHAAARMEGTGNYRALVLRGAGEAVTLPAAHAEAGLGTAAMTVGLALAFAAAGLTGALRGRVGRVAGGVIDGLRALQSGQVGDYVAWLVAGMAA